MKLLSLSQVDIYSQFKRYEKEPHAQETSNSLILLLSSRKQLIKQKFSMKFVIFKQTFLETSNRSFNYAQVSRRVFCYLDEVR